MRKLIYILTVTAITALISFTTKPFTKPTVEGGTCTVPYNLDASKSGSYITLDWDGDPVTHSYGGYYNYYDDFGNATTQNFGSSTNTWPITMTVPSSTYRITYSATAYCTDSTYSTSQSYTENF